MGEESDREREDMQIHLGMNDPELIVPQLAYDEAAQILDYPGLLRMLPEDGLQTPRKARWNKKVTRKRTQRPVTTVRKGRMSAYCICNELQTEKLHRHLVHQKREKQVQWFLGGSEQQWSHRMYMGVVYSTDNLKTQDDPLESKHVFSFPYGCLVFWGFTKTEEVQFIEGIKEFAVEPVSKDELEESYDDLNFVYGDHWRIGNYEIMLQTPDPEEKLSLSFAMAQSAKLFVFEDRVDVTISDTKHIPLALAETGKIDISRTEISKLTGKVFIERNDINLHSETLDTPEFFWEVGCLVQSCETYL